VQENQDPLERRSQYGVVKVIESTKGKNVGALPRPAHIFDESSRSRLG
jgi:hypothetical protein